MQRFRMTSSVALGVMLTIYAMPVSAAECFDILGCTDHSRFSMHFGYLASRSNGPNCDFLWEMRNRIYQEHGYCFKTTRGRSEIGNQGCSIDDIAAVPLNGIERENVATIARAERLKECAR